MGTIQGGNNPKSTANVDINGRLLANAISQTEQQKSAEDGNAFNLNTGQITLTSAAETPIFYLKNNSEPDRIKVPRLFFTALASTGGTGRLITSVYANITGGTILTGTDLTPFNFNFGSGNNLGMIAKLGGTGITFAGGIKTINTIFTSVPIRDVTAFDSIILPRSASLLVTCTPPAGNTSMIVEFGCNFFKEIVSLV